MNHSKKYLAAGIIVSNLIMIFIGAFIFPWAWGIMDLNHHIGLLIIVLITMVTFCSAVASYFWSFTGLPLKSLRWLAVSNMIWLWVLCLFHPELGPKIITYYTYLDVGQQVPMKISFKDDLLYNFFSKFTLLIVVFCSLLGNWFGRRVFYE
jgi:hypothetical protein